MKFNLPQLAYWTRVPAAPPVAVDVSPRSSRSTGVRLYPIAAFTLMEVMIAMAIFFIAVFAILNVVIQSLGTARALQTRHADAGMLAAWLTISNQVEEGYDTGDFEDLLPNYRWEREITEVGSNGLFMVDFAVFEKHKSGKESAERMKILLYRPGSPKRGGLR